MFEEGLRLHDLNGPSLFDISVILRQHEFCHRPKLRPYGVKIALFGNSSVFGIHVPASQCFAGVLNERWDSRNKPLHMYNLGHVFPYQLKDALILREALEYKPDLIVYGISLSDFLHLAPIPWPEALAQFFIANDAGIDRMADKGVAGLDSLVDIYRERADHRSALGQHWTRLHESGSYLRLAARHEVIDLGVSIQHDPSGDCYNRRYPNQARNAFGRWVREEANSRGLEFWDLQNLLAKSQFEDSIHLTESGHRRIAEELARRIELRLRTRPLRRSDEPVRAGRRRR